MSLTIRKNQKKCIICGRRVFSPRSKYCKQCSLFQKRMDDNSRRNISPEAVKGIWAYVHKHYFECYFTHMHLEMKNRNSPWYLVFSHLIPGDGRHVVLTSAIINGMKSVCLLKEFWRMVLQVDENFRIGCPIRKIKIAHWERFYAQRQERLRLHESLSFRRSQEQRLRLSDGSLNKFLKLPCTKGKCYLCSKRLKSGDQGHPLYCLRCSNFVHRLDKRRFPHKTVKAILQYVRQYGFVCYYTRMPLDMDNPRSPWYLVFDHWIPRDDRKVVLTFALLNEMKLDMLEKEFRAMIGQLANFKRDGTRLRKIKILHWQRFASLRPADLTFFKISGIL